MGRTTGIHQRSEDIEDRTLPLGGEGLAHRADVLERRVIIRREDEEQARDLLEQAGEMVAVLGEIVAGTGRVDLRG